MGNLPPLPPLPKKRGRYMVPSAGPDPHGDWGSAEIGRWADTGRNDTEVVGRCARCLTIRKSVDLKPILVKGVPRWVCKDMKCERPEEEFDA